MGAVGNGDETGKGEPSRVTLGLGRPNRNCGLPSSLIDSSLQFQELFESNKSLIANPRDFLETVDRLELAILFAVIEDSLCLFRPNIW